MRLIDADALMREFAEFVRRSNNSDFADIPMWNDAVSLLGSAPTIDAVPVVRCKECKHRPIDTGGHNYGQDLFFPDEDNVCPCQCGDQWYSWMPGDDWFCANGERREDD